ncbi:MAG: Crp/Fnr family transcriptional regulator [Acidobacteriota bacterium]
MQTTHENIHAVPAYQNGEFFSQLSEAAQAEFEEMVFASAYPAHTVLFSETQSSTGIYIVLEGEVRLSISSSDGRRLSFRIAKAGEVLGLSSTVSGKGHEMTAETLYPAKVAHVCRQSFLQFLARHPDAYQVVAREMIRTFNVACEQLRMVGLAASAPERLARLLLGWSESSTRQDNVARCRLSLTHEEIGEFIGASRETVTRTLSTFKHRRLVSQHGSTLTIPNPSALETYACS